MFCVSQSQSSLHQSYISNIVHNTRGNMCVQWVTSIAHMALIDCSHNVSFNKQGREGF